MKTRVVRSRGAKIKGRQWVNVAVPKDLYDLLKKRADAEQMSLAFYVRRLLSA